MAERLPDPVPAGCYSGHWHIFKSQDPLDLPMPPESVANVLSNFNPKIYDRTPKKVVAAAE